MPIPIQPVRYTSTFDPALEQSTQNLLMQRQQGYDTAFAGMAEEQARLGDMFFLDQDTKDKAMQSFAKRQEDILKQYEGDYGAASKALTNLVVSERNNPIYNLNKYQQKQVENFQQDYNKIGPENAIVIKDPTKDLSLYKTDSQGNKILKNTSDLDYSVTSRSDYDKIYVNATIGIANTIKDSDLLDSNKKGYYLQQIETRGLANLNDSEKRELSKIIGDKIEKETTWKYDPLYGKGGINAAEWAYQNMDRLIPSQTNKKFIEDVEGREDRVKNTNNNDSTYVSTVSRGKSNIKNTKDVFQGDYDAFKKYNNTSTEEGAIKDALMEKFYKNNPNYEQHKILTEQLNNLEKNPLRISILNKLQVANGNFNEVLMTPEEKEFDKNYENVADKLRDWDKKIDKDLKNYYRTWSAREDIDYQGFSALQVPKEKLESFKRELSNMSDQFTLIDSSNEDLNKLDPLSNEARVMLSQAIGESTSVDIGNTLDDNLSFKVKGKDGHTYHIRPVSLDIVDPLAQAFDGGYGDFSLRLDQNKALNQFNKGIVPEVQRNSDLKDMNFGEYFDKYLLEPYGGREKFYSSIMTVLESEDTKENRKKKQELMQNNPEVYSTYITYKALLRRMGELNKNYKSKITYLPKV